MDKVTILAQINIKISCESRDIDKKCHSMTRRNISGIFRLLAVKGYVLSVIWNEQVARTVDARGDSSHRKKWALGS